MLQPFIPFQHSYITQLQKAKKLYIVAQFYPRGAAPLVTQARVPLLFTEYEDLGLAKIHLNALKKDKWAAIINLELDSHQQKVSDMLKEGSDYVVYWSMVKDNTAVQKVLDQRFRQHMKRYIEKNTNWRISRDTTIIPHLEVIFGELFITLKHGSQQLKVKFEDIENS